MGIQRNRDRGRDTEKAIAQLMGGTRFGLYGGEDIIHHKYSIEVKSREKFIGEKWMDQCIKNNKQQKIPLVVVHKKGTKYENSYVVIHLKEFLQL